MRTAIYTGSRFEELAGYSRAVVDDPWIFMSGTSGHDPVTGEFPDDAIEQAQLALKTIGETLVKVGSGFADVVQVRVYLASRSDVLGVSKLLGQTFSDPRPTNTTIICQFPAEEIKVEIEVVAKRQVAASA